MGIEELREKIDKIDREMLELLSRRLSIAREIGGIKSRSKMPVKDEEREEQVLGKLEEEARNLGLEEEFVKAIYSIILEKSREEQA